MDRLKRIIGPAPSELTAEALVWKIEGEHRRVSGMLQAFRERPPKGARKKKAAPKPKAAKNKDLIKAAEELGLSVEEFIALAKEQKETERKKRDAKGSTTRRDSDTS